MVCLRPSPGKPEVADLWLEVPVQQDVARLDVAVDYVAGVQVAQPASGAQGNVGPLLPRQRLCAPTASKPISNGAPRMIIGRMSNWY